MRRALTVATSVALVATPIHARASQVQAAPHAAEPVTTPPAAAPAPALPSGFDPNDVRRPSGDLALTAGAGVLGRDPIYSLRLAYFPLSWLGAEANLAHNPSGSEHAVLHYANA